MGSWGSVFLLDVVERGEVDGLIEVDEAFVVVVWQTRCSADNNQLRGLYHLPNPRHSLSGFAEGFFMPFSVTLLNLTSSEMIWYSVVGNEVIGLPIGSAKNMKDLRR